MRAIVLSPISAHDSFPGGGWGATAGRKAAEVWKAGRYFERFAALTGNPALTQSFKRQAESYFEASGLDQSEDAHPDEEVKAAAAAAATGDLEDVRLPKYRSRMEMQRVEHNHGIPLSGGNDSAAALATGSDGLVKIRHLAGADGMVSSFDIPGGIQADANYDAPIKMLMPSNELAAAVEKHGIAELKRLGMDAFTEKYLFPKRSTTSTTPSRPRADINDID
eukprot:1950473-Prymnesium_polylepis.1